MWNTSLVNHGCQSSVADLLVSALRSVLTEAEALRCAKCEHPVIEPGSENDEIIERLAEFRARVKEIERREAVMIAGVSQARAWAHNLRKLAPRLKTEIDVFRLATSRCAVLPESWFSNAFSQFNGGKRLQNYLDQRYRKTAWADGRDGGVDYEVCGKVAVSDIVLACEALLLRLAPHYGEASAEFVALEGPMGSGLETAPAGEREGLDSEQTAEGMQALRGLEMRAAEAMRLARAVQARADAEAEAQEAHELQDSQATKKEKSAQNAGRRLSAATIELTDEFLLPLDDDDFFAGVPGVDLGHA